MEKMYIMGKYTEKAYLGFLKDGFTFTFTTLT